MQGAPVRPGLVRIWRNCRTGSSCSESRPLLATADTNEHCWSGACVVHLAIASVQRPLVRHALNSAAKLVLRSGLPEKAPTLAPARHAVGLRPRARAQRNDRHVGTAPRRTQRALHRLRRTLDRRTTRRTLRSVISRRPSSPGAARLRGPPSSSSRRGCCACIGVRAAWARSQRGRPTPGRSSAATSARAGPDRS